MNGGEGGIRTREPPYGSHTLSKRALSTTQTPLQFSLILFSLLQKLQIKKSRKTDQ